MQSLEELKDPNMGSGKLGGSTLRIRDWMGEEGV